MTFSELSGQQFLVFSYSNTYFLLQFRNASTNFQLIEFGRTEGTSTDAEENLAWLSDELLGWIIRKGIVNSNVDFHIINTKPHNTTYSYICEWHIKSEEVEK